MKTQIQFRQSDGDTGIALIEGATKSLEQAKQELANKLDLAVPAGTHGSASEIDARLRNGGIDPDSITFDQVAE